MDLLVFFNDFRYTRSWADLPTPAEPAALTARTRFCLDFTTERAHAKLFFTVEPASDNCRLCLLMDTAYVPRRTGETLLRGVERLLVASLDGDVPTAAIADVAGLTPVRRPAGWARIGPDWLDPAATVDLLRRAAPARYAMLDLPVDAARPTGTAAAPSVLTAYLVPEHRRCTVRDVHDRVMAALVGRTDVLAPSHYVLCAEPPDDPGDVARWRACRRLAEGDGRTSEAAYSYGPMPPEGP